MWIQRYILLLEDLIKHTDKMHPDYTNVQHALDLMRDVANQINASFKGSVDDHL